jgi:hypothetical protein
MRINRENYEEFLVDYAEGVLSAKVMQEVEGFLLLNPDIREEFDTFSEALLERADISFLDKGNLKKIPFEETTSSSDYFQQLCVAHVEGVIPEADESFLFKLVSSDADKKHELELFEKTKLIIDHFNYNEKLLIKKPEIIHNVTHNNFEEYCIASIEGWLDQTGLVALNNFIAANPKQKATLDSYYKTRLKPDLSIVYPNKRKIKKFSILSPNVKKYGTIISTAAAIVVMAFMVFYTTTLDDKSKIAGSIVTSSTIAPETFNTNIAKAITNSEINQKKEPKKSLKNDPFGLTKIRGNDAELQRDGLVENRILVNSVKPIELNEIDCPPCKQAFTNRTLASVVYKKPEEINELSVETNKQKNKFKTEPAWEVAQVGITGLNKITNTKLIIERDENGNKT